MMTRLPRSLDRGTNGRTDPLHAPAWTRHVAAAHRPAIAARRAVVMRTLMIGDHQTVRGFVANGFQAVRVFRTAGPGQGAGTARGENVLATRLAVADLKMDLLSRLNVEVFSPGA